MPNTWRYSRRLLYSLYAVLWPFVCAPALAGGFSELLQPALSKADHQAIVRMLRLDATQSSAADILFDGYTDGHLHEAAKLRELYQRHEAAVKSGDADARVLGMAFRSAFTLFSLRKDSAVQEYMLSMHTLPSPEQSVMYWASAERYVRRKLIARVSPRLASSWYSVDIVACINEAAITDPPKPVADVLAEYEIAVDVPLQRLQSLLRPVSGQWGDAEESRLVNEGEAIGQSLAAINHKYARWIADLLPEGQSESFTRTAREKAYWSMGTVSAARQRSVALRDQIAALGDLTGEQSRQIHGAFDAMDIDLGVIEKSIVADFDQADSTLSSMSADEWRTVSGTTANPCEQVRARAFTRCDEAAARLERALRAALSEQQQQVIWPRQK